MSSTNKVRFKTWYWGKYIYSGDYLDSSRVTESSDGFESYVERLHGSHLSVESGFRQVSKDLFYSYVNPRDICVTSKGCDYSRWETRSRVEVGRSFLDEDDGTRTYFLTESALAELKQGT